MTTTLTCKIIISTLILLSLASCGSAQIIPTRDVCHIIRHETDDIHQVKINDQLINKRWYLKDDAIVIAKDLHSKNLCTSSYQLEGKE